MKNWTDKVRRVTPYVPGEQPRDPHVIKLNTNENPYPPSPAVQSVLRDFDAGVLRKYPDPEATELKEALASYYGRKTSEIFVGVGSDDVLAMSFLTFFNSDQPILFPDVTYSFYNVWADLFRIPYRTVPLDADFGLDPDGFSEPCGGIVIPNPNAPTGIAADPSVLEDIIRRHPECVVIIDEAYVDFGGESVLPLIDRYDNLLVVRTFSKSRSLAGQRIGFAFGNEKLIRCLSDVRYSFNSYTMDSVTIRVGTASVRDDAYFRQTTGQIIRTREHAKEELRKIGFSMTDSKTNFLFAAHPSVSAGELFRDLKAHGIYVRYFDAPRTDSYLRITVGTDEEMEALFSFLRERCRA